ncbi:alcohol dehydrogenase [Xylariales sp. AK1849]|nr:alcohol dehydrogenase [Xylariales sp. AK1849]
MANHPTSMRALVQTAPNRSGTDQLELSSQFQSFLSSFPATLPCNPGTNAIGRVVATGPDATVLSESKLVITNTFIRARDDTSNQILWGISPGAAPEENHLYASMVCNSVCAEYVLAPLENTYALDETCLLGDPLAGDLGLKIPNLHQLVFDIIVYSDLRSIDPQAGERIITTPATGQFSAAAVDVAIAIGAMVAAASRNGEVTDSKALAAFGIVDAVMDISPPEATGSNSIAVATSVLRRYGRISLMGGRLDETLPVPYMTAVMKSMTIRPHFMFQLKDQRGIIKLAESGLLELGDIGGHNIVATYRLGELSEALDKAVETSGPGNMVVLKP